MQRDECVKWKEGKMGEGVHIVPIFQLIKSKIAYTV